MAKINTFYNIFEILTNMKTLWKKILFFNRSLKTDYRQAAHLQPLASNMVEDHWRKMLIKSAADEKH